MEDELAKDLNLILSTLLGDFDDNEYYKELFGSNIEMLELLFDNYFRKVEGFACSHDKSVYTVANILKALENNKTYSLSEFYDIEKYPQMKQYEGEIAYWCPKTLSNTDEAIRVAHSVLSLDFEIPEKDSRED